MSPAAARAGSVRSRVVPRVLAFWFVCGDLTSTCGRCGDCELVI